MQKKTDIQTKTLHCLNCSETVHNFTQWKSPYWIKGTLLSRHKMSYKNSDKTSLGKSQNCMRFEILKEVNITVSLLAHDTTISGRHHCSRQTWCLHLHTKRGITLKTEALHSSETSEPISLTMLLHIPLECTLYFISIVSNLITLKHNFSKQLYSSTYYLSYLNSLDVART